MNKDLLEHIFLLQEDLSKRTNYNTASYIFNPYSNMGDYYVEWSKIYFWCERFVHVCCDGKILL